MSALMAVGGRWLCEKHKTEAPRYLQGSSVDDAILPECVQGSILHGGSGTVGHLTIKADQMREQRTTTRPVLS